jgi:hypothetical protein
VRDTNRLETVEAGTCQETKKKPSNESHSPPRDTRRGDLSGHGKATEKGHPQTGDGRWRTSQKMKGGGTCQDTESDRAEATDQLDMVEEGACQDTLAERKQQSKRYSQTGDGRGRDLSGHGKKMVDREALTLWRGWRERLVMEGGRSRPSKEYLLSGDGIGRILSGHKEKVTELEALTNWRRQMQ